MPTGTRPAPNGTMTPDTASHPARLIGGRPLAYAVGATLGYAADHLFGDPRRAHPVAAFGRTATALESRLWRDNRAAGALHTALSVGATVATAALATAVARRGTIPGRGQSAWTPRRSPYGRTGPARDPGSGHSPAAPGGSTALGPEGGRGESTWPGLRGPAGAARRPGPGRSPEGTADAAPAGPWRRSPHVSGRDRTGEHTPLTAPAGPAPRHSPQTTPATATPGPGRRSPEGTAGAAPWGSWGRNPRSSGRDRAGEQVPFVLLAAFAAWAVLGGASLRREALGIAHALRAHDLDDARHRLPRLCGRDPHRLGEADIARAVVESVAENTSDAVVGALLWGAVGGVPGLAGFRAVNTLDAMVGHKSARYLRFGWAAARLDDLAGYPGARLTAALAALAGPDPRAARRVWREDGPRHPSPNAGPVEAAFAGALGLRLGGELSYAGRTEHRAVLNPAGRAPDVHDIERAVRLSARVSFLALLTTTLAAALLPTEASHA